MLGKPVLSLALCLGCAAVLPVLAADKVPLNAKPGLWEVTIDTERNGALPIPPEALARLTPEQRQKFEAQMEQSMGPRHRVTRRCVTQEQIDKLDDMDQMGKNCRRTVTSSSSTLYAGSFTCSGQANASGTYRFEAKNPTSVTGNMNMTMSNGGKSMATKSTFSGKWVAADCGSVKPQQ